MQSLRGDELEVIAAWLKQRARMKPTGKSFFVSARRKALHRATVNAALKKYSELAPPFLAHPHMLRNACGFALAGQGADTRLIQDYLGHRNIQHHQIHRQQPRPVREVVALSGCAEVYRRGESMAKKALCDNPLSLSPITWRLKDAENGVLAWISRYDVAFRPLAK